MEKKIEKTKIQPMKKGGKGKFIFKGKYYSIHAPVEQIKELTGWSDKQINIEKSKAKI